MKTHYQVPAHAEGDDFQTMARSAITDAFAEWSANKTGAPTTLGIIIRYTGPREKEGAIHYYECNAALNADPDMYTILVNAAALDRPDDAWKIKQLRGGSPAVTEEVLDAYDDDGIMVPDGKGGWLQQWEANCLAKAMEAEVQKDVGGDAVVWESSEAAVRVDDDGVHFRFSNKEAVLPILAAVMRAYHQAFAETEEPEPSARSATPAFCKEIDAGVKAMYGVSAEDAGITPTMLTNMQDCGWSAEEVVRELGKEHGMTPINDAEAQARAAGAAIDGLLTERDRGHDIPF